jgi:hypothetical protein
MDDILQQRYHPRNGSGLVDTKTGRYHPRDYGAVEIQELTRWLNERAKGYPTMVFAANKA